MNAPSQSRFGGLLRGVAATLVGVVGLWAATPETNAPKAHAESIKAPPTGNSTNAVAEAGGKGAAAPSTAAPTNAPAQLDYASFRMISERNIFNQNRTPRRPGRNQGGGRPVRVDSFTLVGTMSYSKGDMAFFDGTGAEYRKALKPAGSIAGYKVTAITNTAVTLQAAGKTIELPVGAQMRREEGGEWQLAGRHRAEAGGTNATTTAAGDHAAETSSENDSSGAGNDVLQRLLKKREQEMNDEKQ